MHLEWGGQAPLDVTLYQSTLVPILSSLTPRPFAAPDQCAWLGFSKPKPMPRGCESLDASSWV